MKSYLPGRNNLLVLDDQTVLFSSLGVPFTLNIMVFVPISLILKGSYLPHSTVTVWVSLLQTQLVTIFLTLRFGFPSPPPLLVPKGFLSPPFYSNCLGFFTPDPTGYHFPYLKVWVSISPTLNGLHFYSPYPHPCQWFWFSSPHPNGLGSYLLSPELFRSPSPLPLKIWV